MVYYINKQAIEIKSPFHGVLLTWDLDLEITEIIGEYGLDENNNYIYKELSKHE